MNKGQEFAVKLERMGDWLSANGLDGVVLSRSDNFAWLGCGASNVVNSAQEAGVATLIAASDGVTLVANNIEAERLLTEELDGVDLAGAETFPWHEPSQGVEVIRRLVRGRKFAADDGSADLRALPDGFAQLRYTLTEAEVERYRSLGADCSAAMEAAAFSVAQGMTEAEVAGLVALNCRQLGVAPIVLLVAADDRIASWRHPIVKETPAEQCVMMVICGRRQGLVAALTRLVHFGAAPDDLAGRHRAVCAVDAAMMAATVPGREARQVLAEARQAYADQGFPGEWQHHHQGGAIGYQPREYLATPECTEVVEASQAFAWNPSIRGTKSEDTILVGPDAFELLTAPSGEWPTLEVEAAGGGTQPRADFLVR